MQALSFAVHIPLVCFGVSLPAMVLYVEWLYLRSGDELYRTIARRWTRVMAALFGLGGVYAVARLRGRVGRYERTALAVPLTVAALAAPIQILVGDWNGRVVAEKQPIKLAAFEGLGHTEKGAPIHVLGLYRNGKV